MIVTRSFFTIYLVSILFGKPLQDVKKFLYLSFHLGACASAFWNLMTAQVFLLVCVVGWMVVCAHLRSHSLWNLLELSLFQKKDTKKREKTTFVFFLPLNSIHQIHNETWNENFCCFHPCSFGPLCIIVCLMIIKTLELVFFLLENSAKSIQNVDCCFVYQKTSNNAIQSK